jgi:putative mRNA 3-end processing factor
MIIDDFLILDEIGLYCATGNFYLDPKQAVSKAVISHAHGDHAVRGNETVYCTEATAQLMELRYKKSAGLKFNIYSFDESFYIEGVKMTFIPAGHILGSAQILLEYKGIRYLYTGDYKLQADPTCEPIEFAEADVLITETTFADPLVQHPNPVSEIQKLNSSMHNVLLGAYALGKAQRLISLITENCPDRKVLIHYGILPINKLYEKFGFKPGIYEPYNRKLMKQPGMGYVYIVPPMTFDSYFRAKGVMRAFASGWKQLQRHNDFELLISDHVDWNDILKMIEMVKPREIWTIHGDGKHLKQYFENRLPIKILNKC